MKLSSEEISIAHKAIHTAYPKTARNARQQGPRYFTQTDFVASALLTLLASITRLWRLGYANRVVWDEGFFGKFGAMYLNGTFIDDLHPPLTKLIIAFAQYTAGHNGTFDFMVGDEFPDYVNYVAIRAQVAVFGILLVPLAYLTLRRLGVSVEMGILAAAFVMFDNAICLMSRLIILDGPLMAFTALVLFCLVSFNDQRANGREFSKEWWLWLTATGVSLGLVLSTKWIGAFSVMLVGLSVSEDLFKKLSAHNSWRSYLNHWIARALALIALPIAIYMGVFKVHFLYQYKSGVGDHLMPTKFQAQLKKNMYNHQPYDIAYGGSLKIRNVAFHDCRYLQSTSNSTEDRMLPQMVGCKDVRTGEDWWDFIHPLGISKNYSDTSSIEFVKHNSTVAFVNELVQKRLYVNPGTLMNSTEVSWYKRFYPLLVVKVANSSIPIEERDTDWIVDIVEQEHKGDRVGNLLHPITSVFRLRHASSGCVLTLAKRVLDHHPVAGALVVCVPPAEFAENKAMLAHSYWRVEFQVDMRQGFNRDNSHKIKTSFFRDFVQQNINMARANNQLLPDEDKYSHLESSPWSWPFLTHPMRIGQWDEHYVKFYESGNPVLWWSAGLLCCLLYPLHAVYRCCANKRQSGVQSRAGFGQPTASGGSGTLWLGWAVHYLSFFFISRVKYLHHYLPALYFGLLLLAQQIDSLIASIATQQARSARIRRLVLFALTTVVFGVFWHFRKFTYGWKHSPNELAHLQWLGSWNIYEDRNEIK